jgi:hypothetical protein
MRAHYKRSKHLIGTAWFRLWISPAFEEATCGNAPAGEDPVLWSRQWTSPETPSVTRDALDKCNQECPVLEECRALVDLGEKPKSVVQAGQAYGLRVAAAKKQVASAP